MNLKDLEKRIQKLMNNEDIKTPEFRQAIVTSELGDVAKYITHDPKINPNARPHGTKDDEILAYGQVLIQLVGLAYLRNVDVESALEIGLRNWEDADWRKAVASGDGIKGIVASPGYISGEAYVAEGSYELDNIPKTSILVTPYATPDVAVYLDNVLGCVTDHGGFTCHMANVARDKGVPCIVGTGNATSKIQTGDYLTLEAFGDVGKVLVKKE